ncbi:MAG TPA: S8 family serine peptidase [Bacteroidales bacterium]
MKKLYLIAFGLLFYLGLNAQMFTIGNDTIYKINGVYCYITPYDTVRADSTVITINFEDNVNSSSRSSFVNQYNLTFKAETAAGNIQYNIPYGQNYITICNQIGNDSRVERMQTHFHMKLATKPVVYYPNDDELSDQWHLERIGVFNGESNYGAWDLTTGSPDIAVALLDAGLEIDVDEFGPVYDEIDVVYHNPGEDEWFYWDYPESGNGIDDDNNGYIDDWKGWDFTNIYQDANGNHITTDNDVRSNHSAVKHGTGMASIIAAKTNNYNSIAGIAGGDIDNNESGIKLIPIKIYDLYYDYYQNKYVDYLSTADVELAIYYAINQGAKVINMSFECYYDIKIDLKEEINTAYEQGITVIASTGNGNIEFISYPAREENVIAVGATDFDDERWVFNQNLGSNYGNQIDLSAPGENILVLDNNGSSYEASGTSISTAIVSATVALMLSVNPDLSPEQIESILKSTAEKVGNKNYIDGWNKYYGYGRINTYAAVCAALEEKSAIDVTSNETWDNRVLSKKNITIEPGVTLTVEGEVYMGENTKIIVKPGAKLIVDHGIISNFPFCGEENNRWSGIEVWGDVTKHQMTINGSNAQGMLVLNSATIENAVCAVRLFEYSNVSTTTGGIVIAQNSNFVNNNRAVSFFPFKNIYMDDEFDYISHFTNCKFIVDEDYISSYHTFEGEHIMMYGVKGIKFFGCTFVNNLDSDPSGTAINSCDAGFRIDGYCVNSQTIPCPSGNYLETTFTNFKKAVYAVNTGNTLYTSTIMNSIFDNNGYGIHFNNVNDAVVIQNDFILGYIEGCGVTNSKGIFMDNCKRFAIEENQFSLHSPPAAIINTGIQINNTNNASDEVYKNTFDNMLFGNYARGKNWFGYNTFGLSYYCNINEINEWDFYVADYEDETHGIQQLQGNRYNPAANTFSVGASSHFENNGFYELDYYYNQNMQVETPDINKLYRVNRVPINLSNNCPSHYGGGDIRLSSAQIQQRLTDYYESLANYNLAKTRFDSIGSQGDSGLLQLYTEQMSYYNGLYSIALYDMLRSDLADTLAHQSEVNSWLLYLDNYAADESRIDLFIQQGKYSNAMALLDSLALIYTFTAYDSIEYPFYQAFKTLQYSWLNDDRNVFELNTGEISQLVNIADSSQGSAGAQARGILEFAYPELYSYIDCLQMPDTTLKNRLISGSEKTENVFISITARPNPATYQLTFEYYCPKESKLGTIYIWNANSQLIKTINFKTNEGIEIVNVENWPAGVYFYSFTNELTVRSGKFVVNR